MRPSGPARAAARPLSFAEALLNEIEPGFYTLCAGGAADLHAAATAADPLRLNHLRGRVLGVLGSGRTPHARDFRCGRAVGALGVVSLCVCKALGCAWKALGGSIRCILRVWKALGGSICRILRVWEGQILTDLSGPKPT